MPSSPRKVACDRNRSHHLLRSNRERCPIMKIPGPDHPITIAPNPKRVVVTFAGRTIADTKHALALRN